jgi:hypothetical protein
MQYLNSREGARYIAFQSEFRSISNQALVSLMAQEPITAEEPSDAVLRHRQQMLSLGIRFENRGGRRGTSPGSFGSRLAGNYG